MTYARSIATAKRLIAAKGQPVTWKQSNLNAFPDQPWKATDGGTTDYPVTIVFLKPQAKFGRAIEGLLRGTEVEEKALRGLMPAVGFVPDTADQVIRGEQTLNIRAIDPLSPNGEIIMYSIEFQS